MENKLIEITPTVFGVIVPMECDILDCEICHDQDDYNQMYLQYPSDKYLCYQNYSSITLGVGKFKIHGTCTLPKLEFDFEVDESWVEKIMLGGGVFKKQTCLYKDHLSVNENICFINDTESNLRIKSFRTRIQKAINDLGLYAVNPKGEYKPMKGLFGKDKMHIYETHNQWVDRINKWQSAESKKVKGKILIIEKI